MKYKILKDSFLGVERFGALRSGGLYPQKPNRITKV